MDVLQCLRGKYGQNRSRSFRLFGLSTRNSFWPMTMYSPALSLLKLQRRKSDVFIIQPLQYNSIQYCAKHCCIKTAVALYALPMIWCFLSLFFFDSYAFGFLHGHSADFSRSVRSTLSHYELDKRRQQELQKLSSEQSQAVAIESPSSGMAAGVPDDGIIALLCFHFVSLTITHTCSRCFSHRIA